MLKIKISLNNLASILKISAYFNKVTKFPHIFRKITASLPSLNIRAAILLFLILASGINLVVKNEVKDNQENLLINNILRQPFESTLHQDLAQYYLSKNMAASEEEFSLAEEYLRQKYSNINVLGWTRPLEIYTKQWEDYEKQIKYWQEINKIYPDYYFSLLKQAVLYNSIGKNEESRKLFEMILKEIPADNRVLEIYQKLNPASLKLRGAGK